MLDWLTVDPSLYSVHVVEAWIGAAIAGAAVLGSAWLSSEGQKDANRTNKRLAREQMEFQERMGLRLTNLTLEPP